MGNLYVKQIINTDLATSSEAGELIAKILNDNIKQKKHTNIYFNDLITITTAFFNASIGDLYSIWDKDTLNKYITIVPTSLTPGQSSKLKLSMMNAKTKLSDAELGRY